MPHCQLDPTCNSLLQVPFLFWLLEGAGAKISKLLVLVIVFDAMVSILLALGFGRALLFHYCTHEGRSQHSIADTRVNCSILVTTCPWKICPYNANMQRPFFLQTYLFFAQGRPDGVRKYGKMRPKYGNIRPAWTRPNQKDFFPKKRTFFFTSVRPCVKRSGRVDVLKPRVYFRISVAMCKCLPPQLIIKSRRRFYIST